MEYLIIHDLDDQCAVDVISTGNVSQPTPFSRRIVLRGVVWSSDRSSRDQKLWILLIRVGNRGKALLRRGEHQSSALLGKSGKPRRRVDLVRTNVELLNFDVGVQLSLAVLEVRLESGMDLDPIFSGTLANHRQDDDLRLHLLRVILQPSPQLSVGRGTGLRRSNDVTFHHRLLV